MKLSSRQKKILAGALALCLLLAAGIIAGGFFFQKETEKPLYNADKNLTKGDTEIVKPVDKSQKNDESLVTYVPKNATNVYSIVPKNTDDVSRWWGDFLLISKYRLDMPLDIKQIAPRVEQMTLIAMPSKTSYAEDLAVVLKMKTKDRLDTMQDMGKLAENLPVGTETLVDQPKDDLLMFTSPLSVDPMKKVIAGKEPALEQNQDFIDDTKGVKDSLYWFDFSSYLKSITGDQMKKDNPQAVETIQKKLMGFEDNTRWIGKSSDFGKTWIGKFPSGGYKKDLQNLKEYDSEASGDFIENPGMSEKEKKEMEKKREDASGENSNVVSGDFAAGPLITSLESVAVTTKKDKGAAVDDTSNELGSVRNPVTGKYENPQGDLGYYDSLIMFSPATLTNTLSYSGIPATNIASYTLKVKEGEMAMTTQFQTTSPANELLGKK